MSMRNADRNCEHAQALYQSKCDDLPVALLFVCRIERNRAKLTALGIPLTASALHSAAKTKTKWELPLSCVACLCQWVAGNLGRTDAKNCCRNYSLLAASLGVQSPRIRLSEALHLQCRSPAKKQKPKPLQPAESSRRSSRLQGTADEHEGHIPDDDRELALCLINEECPRCGQVTGLPETLLLLQEQHTCSKILCAFVGFCCCKD